MHMFLSRCFTYSSHTAVAVMQPVGCCCLHCNSVVSCVAGMPLSLDCKAFFGYSGENRRPIIYWMKGEKFVEELAGHIKESEVR